MIATVILQIIFISGNILHNIQGLGKRTEYFLQLIVVQEVIFIDDIIDHLLLLFRSQTGKDSFQCRIAQVFPLSIINIYHL